ncbi:hypothetical protein KAX17_17035, partial [Candidatus Bipolaricaulota bacterium]|nr:hypothetical protein [Candidatus Bipolaricaulota bacterium]
GRRGDWSEGYRGAGIAWTFSKRLDTRLPNTDRGEEKRVIVLITISYLKQPERVFSNLFSLSPSLPLQERRASGWVPHFLPVKPLQVGTEGV